MDLSGCYEIQSLPGDFFQLTQLEELQLYSTELYSDEIGFLKMCVCPGWNSGFVYFLTESEESK